MQAGALLGQSSLLRGPAAHVAHRWRKQPVGTQHLAAPDTEDGGRAQDGNAADFRTNPFFCDKSCDWATFHLAVCDKSVDWATLFDPRGAADVVQSADLSQKRPLVWG